MAIWFWAGLAMGAVGGSTISPLPTDQIFPTPVGILFPGFNVAAGVNPAALPLAGKMTSVQASYTPSLASGDASSMFGGLAAAKKGLGVGIGTQRVETSGGSVQGIFGGAAFSFDTVSIGLGLRDGNLSGGYNPNVDIGFIVGDQKSGRSLSFGGVLYNLDRYPQLAIGIGYGNVKRYCLEANLLMPPFEQLSTSYYIISLSATLRAEFLLLYFRSSYQTRFLNFSHTLGVGFQVLEHLNLFAQYSPDRTVSAGLNVMW